MEEIGECNPRVNFESISFRSQFDIHINERKKNWGTDVSMSPSMGVAFADTGYSWRHPSLFFLIFCLLNVFSFFDELNHFFFSNFNFSRCHRSCFYAFTFRHSSVMLSTRCETNLKRILVWYHIKNKEREIVGQTCPVVPHYTTSLSCRAFSNGTSLLNLSPGMSHAKIKIVRLNFDGFFRDVSWIERWSQFDIQSNKEKKKNWAELVAMSPTGYFSSSTKRFRRRHHLQNCRMLCRHGDFSMRVHESW